MPESDSATPPMDATSSVGGNESEAALLRETARFMVIYLSLWKMSRQSSQLEVLELEMMFHHVIHVDLKVSPNMVCVLLRWSDIKVIKYYFKSYVNVAKFESVVSVHRYLMMQ